VLSQYFTGGLGAHWILPGLGVFVLALDTTCFDFFASWHGVSCSQYRLSNLGYAKTEIWGPFYESLGGDLPPNTETLHLNWMWSCDYSYNNCKVKERFTLMKAYGNVKWENYKLSAGQYVLQQSSLRNVTMLGTTTAVHPCWN
jgi:hypothetical protein